MTHSFEVETFEERERLQQHRPLPPEARLENLETAMPRLEDVRGGPLDATAIAREIGLGQQPACLPHRFRDSLPDIPAIEPVAGRVDGGLAPAPRTPALGVRERAQRLGKIGLAEDASGLGDLRAGQVNPEGRGRHPLEVRLQVNREEVIPGKAIGQ